MQLRQTVGFRALILYSHVILERDVMYVRLFNDALLFLRRAKKELNYLNLDVLSSFHVK